jgi:hypothetical protein
MILYVVSLIFLFCFRVGACLVGMEYGMEMYVGSRKRKALF